MSIHVGHRQRVKAEFLSSGGQNWPDHRLLELLLFYAIPQGDVNGLAHALMERFGSLSGVLDASAEELKKTPGVGEHTAALLKLIPAIGRHYISSRSSLEERILTTEDAVAALRPYFFGARNEMVYILALDGKKKMLGVRRVSEGCIFSSDVNIRRIAEEALSLRAAGIYLAHNHISNLAFPSETDWMSTDTARAVLAGIGLELIDHIVFVDDDAVSMKESKNYRGRRSCYLL